MSRFGSIVYLLLMAWVLPCCEKDTVIADATLNDAPSPKAYHLKVPPGFPDYFLDKENALTEEGIALGKRLFFDPILSKHRNISCGSCHKQEHAFSDPDKKSTGTNGELTSFHSMPLFNMAWMTEFFWNGRAKSREEQALQPVTNHLEMDMSWNAAVDRLKEHPEYPGMFQRAFGTSDIDSNLVVRALVQFEMTIVSAESRFDRWLRGLETFTDEELKGMTLYNSERGDCFHCHGSVLATDNSFHNNGLDNDLDLEPGLYAVTGNEEDYGKFKTPTLRNLIYTAPYMHDGRFNSLEQVVDFYSDSVQDNRNVDVLMEFAHQGGVRLSDDEKRSLIAFLLTMTDEQFVQDSTLMP